MLSCSGGRLLGGPLVTSSAASWAVVVWLGVMSTAVAYLLFTHALKHISSATGVALALGEPVTAFVLAVLVVGERPGWLAFAGLVLVLAGLAFYLWYGVEWLVRAVRLKDADRAYKAVSFEMEAYSNEDDPNYLENSNYFAWVKYLF